MMPPRNKYRPCRHCEGRGEYWGTMSSDPGERPKWHGCWDCGGTGRSPYLDIPDTQEDEHDERR